MGNLYFYFAPVIPGNTEIKVVFDVTFLLLPFHLPVDFCLHFLPFKCPLSNRQMFSGV